MAHAKLVDFPELGQQFREVGRALALLEQVCAMLEQGTPGEELCQLAQRLRGAAVLAGQAASEIWVSVGWIEAAQAAESHGLLERR